MNFKKTAALLLSVLLVGALFAGCSGAAPESATEGAPPESPSEGGSPAGGGSAGGKITFSIWDLSNALYLQTLVDAFAQEHPGIEVELIDTPSDNYVDKLNIDLNGGAAADVILVKEVDYSMYQKGQLADLSDYVARDSVDLGIFNGLEDSYTFDGRVYGLPFRTDYYILYYNKDLFDAAGEAYPSNDMTWGEFEALAKRLTSGEGATKNYGAFFHTWQALVQNWAVQDGKNTMMGPDYSFMKPAYEMVLRMQNDDQSIQDYATLKTANIHYSSPFQLGNVAMLPMGTWFMATMIDKVAIGESDVNWGIATIPHPDGLAAGNTVGSTTPIVINGASSNKDAAWEFLKFATIDERGPRILAEAGQIPGSVNDELLTLITGVDGMPEGAGEALQVKGIVLDRPVEPFVNEVNKMLEEEHGLIMLGESTIDEGLAAMTERSAEIQG